MLTNVVGNTLAGTSSQRMMRFAVVLGVAVVLPSVDAFNAATRRLHVRKVTEAPERTEISKAPDSHLFGPSYSIPLVGTEPGTQLYVPVQMQLAITTDEHHHGLMFKKSMPEDTGMIFLYRDNGRRVLYMRNTFIGLDGAWFTDDGLLREVMNLLPEDETYRWSERSDIRYGVEMNQGWFARHDLQADRVRLDMNALRIAVSSRGFQPEDFGIMSEKDAASSPSPPMSLSAGEIGEFKQPADTTTAAPTAPQATDSMSPSASSPAMQTISSDSVILGDGSSGSSGEPADQNEQPLPERVASLIRFLRSS